MLSLSEALDRNDPRQEEDLGAKSCEALSSECGLGTSLDGFSHSDNAFSQPICGGPRAWVAPCRANLDFILVGQSLSKVLTVILQKI